MEKNHAIGGRVLVGGVHAMPLSKAIRAVDGVFVSGWTAIDARGGVRAGGVEIEALAYSPRAAVRGAR